VAHELEKKWFLLSYIADLDPELSDSSMTEPGKLLFGVSAMFDDKPGVQRKVIALLFTHWPMLSGLDC